ncbi:hypothetical protein AB1Y20_017506 [Prymnesium parvum]|uniref:SET domain-containing protein n=1 Tax=Prymnesium parvum TaxID=97485 RepID=A0AB34JPK9_PRYPA
MPARRASLLLAAACAACSTTSPGARLSGTPPSLLHWAEAHGAYVARALAIAPATAALPRRLVLTSPLASGTPLVTLPSSLQLGTDRADPALLASAPTELWSARLGLALCAELARGEASPFAEYISALPAAQPCGLAAEGAHLAAWPPAARHAAAMRAAIRTVHARLVAAAREAAVEPPPLRLVRWASAIAGSRAYRVRGSRGAAHVDSACLLPVIDLANYAPHPRANAELRNAPRTGPAASDDPLAVTLYACAPIDAGAEVCIDYGAGAVLSNERLLLEYGFVLPLDEHPHDTLELPFGAIAVGVAAVGAQKEAASEEEALKLLLAQQRLLAQLGDVEAGGLVFDVQGSPANGTFALALILTARSEAELARGSVSSLVADMKGEGASSCHARRARQALHAVASAALDELSSALGLDGHDGDDFAKAAYAYCLTRRKILQRIQVNMS